MIPRAEITVRVDAAFAPTVVPGDRVSGGQNVCHESRAVVFPIAGTVRSVRFDGDAHEFVIVLVPDQES